MNWERFWDNLGKSESDPGRQVGRISSKVAVNPDLLDQISLHIVSQLALKPEDKLLDLCCGNGEISHRLARHCHAVLGVDLSAVQLQLAQQYAQHPSIRFVHGDVLNLPLPNNEQFDKINLYFSFQYLDTFSKGKQALKQMWPRLKPGGRIFLGDIPDQALIRHYYPNFMSRAKATLKQWLGRNDMGKFWAESEIAAICKTLGGVYEWKAQPDPLPYSHYRSDCIIFKPD